MTSIRLNYLRVFLMVGLILIMLALAAGCGKVTNAGSVAGYVLAPSGAVTGDFLVLADARNAPAGYVPLQGVKVAAAGCSQTTSTDSTGRFQLAGVPTGSVSVTLTKAGFSTAIQTAYVLLNEVYYLSTDVPKTSRKWTFLVYLCADNDLEPYGIDDLNEMELVGSSNDVNIVVQIDRNKGYDTSNGNWSGTRRYYVTQDSGSTSINSILVKDLGEKDMSHPATLSDFVSWGMSVYPSDQVALVIWNHGTGVYPRAIGQTQPRGVCFDDTTGVGSFDCLTTDELRLALQNGLPVGKKIDVLNFDACLMQMVEIGYELQNYACLMVGSEEVVPGPGNPYQPILSQLVSNPNMTPTALAEAIVNECANYYQTRSSTTYSAVDLSSTAWATLIQKIDAFANAILGASETELDRLRGHAGTFFDVGNPNPNISNTLRFDYPEMADLHWYANLVGGDTSLSTALRTAANDVKSAVTSAVLVLRNTGSFVTNPANGLAILLPRGMYDWQYYSAVNRYAALKYAQERQWLAAINKLRPPVGSLDSVTIRLNWNETTHTDLDLVIHEPCGIHFTPKYPWTWNGVFSPNAAGTGSRQETYYLNVQHEQGVYYFGVVNPNNRAVNYSMQLTVGSTTQTTGQQTVAAGSTVYWTYGTPAIPFKSGMRPIGTGLVRVGSLENQ